MWVRRRRHCGTVFVQGYALIAPGVEDDAKWGWRTLEGQEELRQEVRVFVCVCVCMYVCVCVCVCACA